MEHSIVNSIREEVRSIMDQAEYLEPKDSLDPEVVEAEVVEAEVVDEEVIKSEPEAIEPQIVEPMVAWPVKQSFLLHGAFCRFWGVPPFPLTATKMAGMALRLDPNGQQQFGFYFTAELQRECTLLLPRPVYCWNDPYWENVLYTWRNNPLFFRCSVIGKILEIYSKIVEAEYADFYSNF